MKTQKIRFKDLQIGEAFNDEQINRFTKINSFAARNLGLRDYNAVNVKTGRPTTFLDNEFITRFVCAVS